MRKNGIQYLIVLAALVLLWNTSLMPAEIRDPDSVIRFGLTSSLVEADVNMDDALAATKLWAATMGKGIGLWKNADAMIFENAVSLMTAVNNGDADVVALATYEYLELQGKLKALPALTYQQAGQVENQYLVLVHRDSPFKTIGDLRNQRIAYTKSGRNNMVSLWLEVLLYESGVKEQHIFFREMKGVQKPSQVILPIFFRQIESGIVLKSSFDTAVELNPQVGKQVRVLASSPKLVMLVTCIRSTLPADRIDQYVQQGLRLHESPSGLQSFELFKLDRLVPWNPSYFDNVRELLKKRKTFRSASAPQPGSFLGDEGAKKR